MAIIRDSSLVLRAILVCDYNSASGSTTINVSKANTTTTLSLTAPSSGNPNLGQSVTFTAQVKRPNGLPGNAALPGGTVTFYASVNGGSAGAISCTGTSDGTLSGTTPDQATCTTKTLSAGTNSVYAVYQGDSNYMGSQSDPI
jgi:hypothetical protein